MKRRIIILIDGVLLLAAGVGIGHVLSIPGPAHGACQYRESPNGKWVAWACTLDDGPVIGKHRTYCEFRIETAPPSPRTIRRVTIEDTYVPPIDWREEGSIVWASNSLAVTFKCEARQATVDTTLKIEP